MAVAAMTPISFLRIFTFIFICVDLHRLNCCVLSVFPLRRLLSWIDADENDTKSERKNGIDKQPMNNCIIDFQTVANGPHAVGFCWNILPHSIVHQRLMRRQLCSRFHLLVTQRNSIVMNNVKHWNERIFAEIFSFFRFRMNSEWTHFCCFLFVCAWSVRCLTQCAFKWTFYSIEMEMHKKPNVESGLEALTKTKQFRKVKHVHFSFLFSSFFSSSAVFRFLTQNKRMRMAFRFICVDASNTHTHMCTQSEWRDETLTLT